MTRIVIDAWYVVADLVFLSFGFVRLSISAMADLLGLDFSATVIALVDEYFVFLTMIDFCLTVARFG
jgi:hypothetical protein